MTAAASCLISDNNVVSNTAGGMLLSGSTGDITGNTINQNLNFGVSLNSASPAALTQNTISSNANYGVFIDGTSGSNISQNTISGYLTSGVAVKSGTGNKILANSIFSNTGIGIDLWAGSPPQQDGITANDGGDGDTGANNLQNYPDLSAAYTSAQGTGVVGNLSSTPSTPLTIQFYSTPTGGKRAGQTYLGEKQVTTDIYGQVQFTANIANVPVNNSDYISSLVYDASGNTSEFSASIPISTDEGLHYKVNKTLAGIPLHWEGGNSTYSVAQSIVSRGYDDEVQTAFNTWSSLDQLTYTRASSDTSELWGGNPDGINNIVWIPNSNDWESIIGAPTNVIAVTRVRYNAFNGELTDVDMAFNGDPISLTGQGHYTWATDGSADNLDVQNTATHEAGHYSGLADLYDPGDLNLDSRSENEQRRCHDVW